MPLSQVWTGSTQAFCLEQLKLRNLSNCEVGGVGNAAADLSPMANECQANSYQVS